MPFFKFTVALSKAIFLPLPCSSAFVNISAKRIRPQLYFPFPQRLTMQSPATLLSRSLMPSQHSRKASLFLLNFFAPVLTTRQLLAMCAISHAKPPTHLLISIEVNLTPVRLLQTHHGCSAPSLSIRQLIEVRLKVAHIVRR